MTGNSSLPLWQQVLVLVLMPPCVSCLCWVMMRGKAASIQGSDISVKTKDRQRFEFWTLIAVLYVGALFLFIYAHLFHFHGIKT
jgi:hypothetical protein